VILKNEHQEIIVQFEQRKIMVKLLIREFHRLQAHEIADRLRELSCQCQRDICVTATIENEHEIIMVQLEVGHQQILHRNFLCRVSHHKIR
jgi:hypothetical protein